MSDLTQVPERVLVGINERITMSSGVVVFPAKVLPSGVPPAKVDVEYIRADLVKREIDAAAAETIAQEYCAGCRNGWIFVDEHHTRPDGLRVICRAAAPFVDV